MRLYFIVFFIMRHAEIDFSKHLKLSMNINDIKIGLSLHMKKNEVKKNICDIKCN